MARQHTADRLIVFCHIEKTAGTMIAELFRRYFGWRHLDVGRRTRMRVGERIEPYSYSPQDLRADLRLYPWAVSLAGHFLRPRMDFEEFSEQMRWFTLVREPLARLKSQFLHEVDKKGRRHDLPTWSRTFVRDDMMVRKIAGEPDLEAAKQILDERFRCVGLQERFDESLVLIRSRLDLGRGFRLSYPAPANTESSRIAETDSRADRAWALDQLEQHRDILLELSHKDRGLHEHVAREIWPRQVAEYGGADNLARDTADEVRCEPHTLRERLRLAQAWIYRGIAYRPYLKATQAYRDTTQRLRRSPVS